MDLRVSFKVNEKIYLKDPASSEVGQQIVRHAIELIYKVGFEQFTFKKLAVEVDTTEATIYRYFENKHRLLLYILNWYWSYMEFLLVFKLQNIPAPKDRLMLIIQLLTHELPEVSGEIEYNRKCLNEIVIAESCKTYLVKEVNEINKEHIYKPYKDLCAKIAEEIKAYKPSYIYARSLSSTLIETAHQQQFFSRSLTKLTDVDKKESQEYVGNYLKDLLFKVLD